MTDLLRFGTEFGGVLLGLVLMFAAGFPAGRGAP